MFNEKACPLWVAAALCLAPLVAGAAQPGVAILIASRDAEAEPDALLTAQVLEELLRKDARFSFIDVTRADREAGARPRIEKTRLGRAKLEEARRLSRPESLPQAVTRTDDAISLMAEGALEDGPKDMVEALAFRALLAHRTGDAAQSQAYLERLFAFAPTHKPEARGDEQHARVAATARESLELAPRASLSIHSRPVSGWVYVDGLLRGVTPLLLESLPSGRHYVTVLAPGYTPFQAQVAPGVDALDAQLVPSPSGEALRAWQDAVRAATSPQALAQVGVDLLRGARVEQTLVASLGIREGKLHVIAARGSQGQPPRRVGRTLEARPGEPERVAKLIHGLLDETPVVDLGPPPEAPGAARVGADRRRLAYAALGASGASALAGGILGLVALGQVSGAEQRPQVDHEGYRRAYLGAQQTSIAANCLYGISLVSAGAAAWLLLTEGGPALRGGRPVPLTVDVTPLPRGGGAVILEASFR